MGGILLSFIEKRLLPHRLAVSVKERHIERAKETELHDPLELAVAERLGVEAQNILACDGRSVSVVDDDGATLCSYSSGLESFVEYQRAICNCDSLEPAEFELFYEGVVIAEMRDDNLGHYTLVDLAGRRIVGSVDKTNVSWLR